MTRLGALVGIGLMGAAVAPGIAADVSVNYACAQGAVLSVAYLNPEIGPGLAVVAWAGRLIPMAAAPTGSGVRYVASDGGATYVWRTKGDEGALSLEDGSGNGREVLGDCRRIGA